MDKVISWNVRGLNKTNKQIKVKKLINNKKISLVGLLETRVRAQNMGALFLRIFRDWCFTSNSAWHNNGRIIVAWDPTVFSMDIQFCTSQCIHCWIEPKNGLKPFYCTFVYAFNEEVKRAVPWDDLRRLRSKSPWVLLGDFNATVNNEERIGERVRTLHSEAFRECLLDCDLEDVHFNGFYFTWSNKQDQPDRIVAKLDRVLGNSTWMEVFEKASVCFLPEGLFDHSPLVLSLSNLVVLGRKPFKYFNMWQRFSMYNEVVSEAWRGTVQGVPMFNVITKLKRVKVALKQMNNHHVGDVNPLYTHFISELERVQQAVHRELQNPQLVEEEKRVRIEHERITGIYLDFLRQKSRLLWLHQGDANTHLFHRSLKSKRKQNTVLAIRDASGNWQDTAEGVQKAFIDYYTHLLGDKVHNRIKVKVNIIEEGPILSSRDTQTLLRPFGKEETREVVFLLIKLRDRMDLIVLFSKSIGTLLVKRLVKLFCLF
ncbi:uncharacterized protein LOC133791548 [Humulus lupulus]|uniref:uncharacterized protein LOC133791548 n=1 Tax=Humulus lupulus TaxID=3486 RepID=UPI002B40D1D3|nr:uncharacterized protein LOC133791548 [Humulus lupulus]